MWNAIYKMKLNENDNNSKQIFFLNNQEQIQNKHNLWESAFWDCSSNK